MEVQINQQITSVSNDTPLSEVLNQQGLIGVRGIAVAVNDSVVPQSDWTMYTLQPDDKIMIIRATQGG